MVDLRNIYRPDEMTARGFPLFQHRAVGRVYLSLFVLNMLTIFPA